MRCAPVPLMPPLHAIELLVPALHSRHAVLQSVHQEEDIKHFKSWRMLINHRRDSHTPSAFAWSLKSLYFNQGLLTAFAKADY